MGSKSRNKSSRKTRRKEVTLTQNDWNYEQLFAILNQQFDEKVALAILSPIDKITIVFSGKTKKFRYLYYNHELNATFRPQLGTFSLTLAAFKRILPKLEFPRLRIQVQDDVAQYIREGKSAFAKHIINCDPSLHVGDEIAVVDSEDHILAVGKLALPPNYLGSFKTGLAVKVRKGNKKN